jgi:hypothetical protein
MTADVTKFVAQQEVLDCTCVHTCAEDPASACSLSGEWHVHPDLYPGAGIFGPCPVHPDAPGDI